MVKHVSSGFFNVGTQRRKKRSTIFHRVPLCGPFWCHNGNGRRSFSLSLSLSLSLRQTNRPHKRRQRNCTRLRFVTNRCRSVAVERVRPCSLLFLVDYWELKHIAPNKNDWFCISQLTLLLAANAPPPFTSRGWWDDDVTLGQWGAEKRIALMEAPRKKRDKEEGRSIGNNATVLSEQKKIMEKRTSDLSIASV